MLAGPPRENSSETQPRRYFLGSFQWVLVRYEPSKLRIYTLEIIRLYLAREIKAQL